MPIDVSPPPWNGPLGVLDRDAFTKAVPVLAADVPANKTGTLLRAPELRGTILNLPRIKTVIHHPTEPHNKRLVLLHAADEGELNEASLRFIRGQATAIIPHTLELKYDYWTADDILYTLLPENLREGSPSGFAVAGHVAHLNLNEEYLPYKHLIGQVILDKNANVRTVVNKLDSIDNKFRFFKMEVLAGENDLVVHHSESDARFTFDFSKVYWNSRLHMEHGRLVDQFTPEDVVADVFAGVGPFAIPAGKKGTAVLANDLNPDSHKYLLYNIQDNKVAQDVRAYCEDGRDFIIHAATRLAKEPFSAYKGPKLSRMKEKRDQRKRSSSRASTPLVAAAGPPRDRISHFVMNLPDSAITFLDAFRGILKAPEVRDLYPTMPYVHCYCFTRELEEEPARADITQRVESALGGTLPKDIGLHLVRSVAPNKHMYCISFQLPESVAMAE